MNALSGTAADTNTPRYQSIKRQLMKARNFYPECRFLYLLRRPAEGPPIILLDSEPADSPDYSPPGQVYEEATPELLNAFRTGTAFTEEAEDRWGRWISTLVPIVDPLDGRVAAIFGMDIDATLWKRRLWPAMLPSLLFGIAATLLLWVKKRQMDRRRSGNVEPKHWWQREEIQAAYGLGLMISAIAAYTVYGREYAADRTRMWNASAIQCTFLQQLMHQIGADHLEGVGRFFMSSAFVSPREFDIYTAYLRNNPYVHA